MLVHVEEMTQPRASTSGSHERYKSKERLSGRRNTTVSKDASLIRRTNQYPEELNEIEKEAKGVREVEKDAAWKAFMKIFSATSTNSADTLEEAMVLDPEISAIRQGGKDH